MTSKKGAKFGKFTLNDYSGNFEIMLWEKSYVQYGNFLLNGQKLMIQGNYDEHKFRPGTMEFQIQNIVLLEQVRKLFTKKVKLSLPLQFVDQDLVLFMGDNIKTHPGNTDLIIVLTDEETGYQARLNTQNTKIELNDDLINYLQSREDIKYSIDKV
jgi:DNA polymerase-3 subunit alpha